MAIYREAQWPPTALTGGGNLAEVKRVLAIEEELAELRATVEHLGVELHQSRNSTRPR